MEIVTDSFNNSLINDSVNFEQLAPDIKINLSHAEPLSSRAIVLRMFFTFF